MRSLYAVFLGTFTLRFSTGLTGGLLLFYLARLHRDFGGPRVDETTLAVMTASFFAAELVLATPFGLLSDRIGVRLPNDRDFSTVAGFALSVLKHLPETGEKFRHDGWSFEIVDMDGRKIDKLIVSRPKKKTAQQPAEPAG